MISFIELGLLLNDHCSLVVNDTVSKTQITDMVARVLILGQRQCELGAVKAFSGWEGSVPCKVHMLLCKRFAGMEDIFVLDLAHLAIQVRDVAHDEEMGRKYQWPASG